MNATIELPAVWALQIATREIVPVGTEENKWNFTLSPTAYSRADAEMVAASVINTMIDEGECRVKFRQASHAHLVNGVVEIDVSLCIHPSAT